MTMRVANEIWEHFQRHAKLCFLHFSMKHSIYNITDRIMCDWLLLTLSCTGYDFEEDGSHSSLNFKVYLWAYLKISPNWGSPDMTECFYNPSRISEHMLLMDTTQICSSRWRRSDPLFLPVCSGWYMIRTDGWRVICKEGSYFVNEYIWFSEKVI